MVSSLMKNRRSIRRFSPRRVKYESLLNMVDCARLAPSAANKQPLKYAVIDGENAIKMFPHTAWAGYSKGAETPAEDQQPSAYILILVDTRISGQGYELDAGAAGMSIILAALEEGIASCWLGSLNRGRIAKDFAIDDTLIINSAIALGYPADTADTAEFKGDVKYFRGDDGKFYVPKRDLDSVLLKIR